MAPAATNLLDATALDFRALPGDATRCTCITAGRRARLIVLTGAPQLGKTAMLNSIASRLCEHVTVLPDAAKVVLQAGFAVDGARCLAAAQRAIYHLQRELEESALEGGRYHTVLCDGGSLDGLARWPLDARRFFADLGTTRKAELARYSTVIHVRRAPSDAAQSDSQVRLRATDRADHAAIDARIREAWSGHRAFHVVDAPPEPAW